MNFPISNSFETSSLGPEIDLRKTGKFLVRILVMAIILGIAVALLTTYFPGGKTEVPTDASSPEEIQRLRNECQARVREKYEPVLRKCGCSLEGPCGWDFNSARCCAIKRTREKVMGKCDYPGPF